MGQHKTNPTAIAAKNGELPPKPKPKPISNRQREREIELMIALELERRTGIYSILNQAYK